MKHRLCSFLSMLMFSVPVTAGVADHLLISEMAVRGGLYVSGYESPEFVEVYNPTGSVISLNNYHLTDWSQYWRYPDYVRRGVLQNEGAGDFIAQFPSTNIPSGGVVTVTANAKQFLLSYFNPTADPNPDLPTLLSAYTNQPGSPVLYEMYDSMPEVADMINLNADTTSGSMNQSHTDAGENVFLFYYDGTSDTVKDVDMLFYKKRGANLGTENGLYPKTDSIDGPDPDDDTTAYLADNGNEDNLAYQYVSASAPYQFERRSRFEAGENSTGGNGITNHDETTEINNISFIGVGAVSGATPGIAHPDLAASDQKPVIYNSETIPEIPSPSAPFTLRTNIWDDNSVASATVHIGDGSTTLTFPMTHGTGEEWTATIPASTFADRTVVTWYVEATDNNSQTASEQNYADFGTVGDPVMNRFLIDSNPADGFVVFNEIQFDPTSSDNLTAPEFVELYNTSSSPIDLSGYHYQYGTAATLVFPSGSVINGHDYLVLVYNPTLFSSQYPTVPSNKVIQIFAATTSQMVNTGGTIALRSWDNITVVDTVTYRVTSPWPGNTVSGSNYAASNTGYTIELLKPTLDNNDGANWVVSSTLGGSPNANNFSIDSSRTISSPTTSDDVIITARIAGTIPTATGTVKLTYQVNGGTAVTVDMTDMTDNYFTANIGKFADRSVITYNIVAEESGSGFTVTASPTSFSLLVANQAQLTEDDILINEMMINPTGTDNGTGNSEWIEFYNLRNTPINLGGVLLGPDNVNAYAVPEGFIVQPNSYFILAGNKTKFTTQYPAVDTNIVLNAGWTNGKLAESGTPVRLVVIDPNQVMINRTNYPGDIVAYKVDGSAGWMNATPASGIENRGYELKNRSLDNNVGGNWALHSGAGTPGVSNSQSAVNNWSLY